MEVNVLLAELEQKPYFLAKYSESLNLYRRIIIRGKFVVYYSIDELNVPLSSHSLEVRVRYLCNIDELNGIIIITHFRSARQIPL